MKSEIKTTLRDIENHLSLIITLGSVLIAFLTSINILWQIGANYFTSKFYDINFNLFQVSFDFHQFILKTMLIFTILAIFKSIKISTVYFWKRYKQKQTNIKIPIFAIVLFLLYLICIIISISFRLWIITGYLIIYVIILGAFLSLIFNNIIKIIKQEDKSEINNVSDLKLEIKNIMYCFACIFIIEFFLCLVTTCYNISIRTEYYIIPTEEENNVYVIIETYPNYYITKHAIEDSNKLIITKNSQRIQNVTDCDMYKKTYDNISFK